MFVVHADVDLLTWDEFLGLPYETRNTGLIDGKMIVNSPNAQHEQIVGNLLFALKLWHRGLPQRLGGPTTQQPVKVSERHGYQPDMSWFPVEQCEPAGQRASFSGLPSIVVFCHQARAASTWSESEATTKHSAYPSSGLSTLTPRSCSPADPSELAATSISCSSRPTPSPRPSSPVSDLLSANSSLPNQREAVRRSEAVGIWAEPSGWT